MSDESSQAGDVSGDGTADPAPLTDRRARTDYRSEILWGAMLVALVTITFSPARRAGFIMDDDINITMNATLYSPAGLIRMWLVPSSVDQYYPLTHTTFWIESRLWGFDPLGYHVVNVMLHAVNTLLLWRLLARLTVPAAWLAAAIFAVHPVTVESVVWAVERKNVLSMCLALGSILCYLRFSPPQAETCHDAATAERWYTASLVLFGLAMFSKTAVVTLPAVLLVIGWWKRGQITRRDVEPLVPFFVIGIALSAVTAYQEKYHCGARGADFEWSFLERFLMAGQALCFYATKVAWPYPIMFFYPAFTQVTAQYLYPVAALAMPITLWLLRGRLGRGALAAVLIFAGVLMPALGFFNIAFFLFAPVADHFQYHACPALIALFIAGAVTAWERMTSAAEAWCGVDGIAKALTVLGQGVAVAMLLALAVRSHVACQVFESEEAIYRDVISKNPASWIAYSQLGVQLAVRDEYAEALAMGRKALEIAPQLARAHHNYASTILHRAEQEDVTDSELEDAIAHFQRAIEINPELAAHYVGLGRALMKAHRYPEAVAAFQRAIEIEPQNDSTRRYLAESREKL